MARKPIELERAGMLTPRERLWAAARKLREFTLNEWQDATKPVVRIDTCETYLRSLIPAGWLEAIPQPKVKKQGFDQMRYRLVKDSLDAPRVGRDGSKVTQGLATLAMWRSMQVLKSFDWHDVQRAASLPARGTDDGIRITDESAKAYVNALNRAGYFQVLQKAQPGTAAKYRLIKKTGAHAPAVTRRKVVFDRNLGDFQWQQPAQEVVDAIAE